MADTIEPPIEPAPVARLRIATDVPLGTTFYESGNEGIRDAFENALKNELLWVVSAYWASWEAIPLPQTHPYEEEVRDLIALRINAVTTPDQLRLTGGAAAQPNRVRYIWRRGRRIRVHTYALEIKRRGTASFEPWVVEHSPTPGVTVTVAYTAELSWELNM